MAQAPPVVLTIAGFDPSSGAGVTADIKTIAAHGCYGVACITALTVQSTAGVRRVEAVSAELVAETLTELSTDVDIASVRIGMLGSAKVTRAVADFLGRKKLENVVLDPILKATSGAALIDQRQFYWRRPTSLRLSLMHIRSDAGRDRFTIFTGCINSGGW